MFIFFHPETRRVHNVITMAPNEYRAFLESSPPNGEEWIETDMDLQFDEIEVLPDRTLRRRQPMTLDYPAIATVNVEFSITGVPQGVSVIVNGAELGIMDDSEILEFTAHTGGVYRFRFEGPGVITKEISIEARD